MQELQTALPLGSILRERYVVEGLLGQGGFGAVYLVKDLRVKGNLFALKEVVDPHKQDRKRFVFEGELLKRLDHRALPRVYRVFDDDEHHRAYMLMDYIEGPNLEILRQKQPGKHFSLPQVLTIIAPIMDAVSYLHSQNPPILHRDIKPSNVIVPASGDEAVLVDFGIAKEYDKDATTTAVRSCSPGYAAPEQYSVGTSTRTDIYALGATLYTLLTATVPADALYRMTQMGCGKGDPLEPLNQLAPAVPLHIAEAIQRALSINNNERFSMVEQFWQALNAYPTWKHLTAPVVVSSAFTPAPLPVEPASTINQVSPGSDGILVGASLAGSLSGGPGSWVGEQVTLSPPEPATVIIHKQPAKRQSGGRRRSRKSGFLLLLFLLLLIASAAGLGILAYMTNRPTARSFVPTSKASSTSTVGISPTSDPTHVPTSVSQTPHPKDKPTSPPIIVPTVVLPTPDPTVKPTMPPTKTPTPHPTPHPSPTPVPYPNIAGNYNGTIVDQTANITTGMSLYIQQKNGQGNLSGYFTVNPPLVGNGDFTGMVNPGKYIQFTVQSYHGNAPLYFWGWVQQDGSLKGDYCSINSQNQCDPSVGASGIWDVFISGSRLEFLLAYLSDI